MLTIIEGGKSQNPGTSHVHTPDSRDTDKRGAGNLTTLEEACEGGILISFDGTPFADLKGVLMVSANIFPERAMTAILLKAMEESRG